MTNAPTPDVEAGITNVLRDCLGIDPEECTPESHLIRDLGAESIDSLDLIFKSEMAFGIRFSRSQWMEGLFGIVLDEGESWNTLENATEIREPWTTAPGTVGRLQEVIRMKLAERKGE